jgi:hypothetical protein
VAVLGLAASSTASMSWKMNADATSARAATRRTAPITSCRDMPLATPPPPAGSLVPGSPAAVRLPYEATPRALACIAARRELVVVPSGPC